jgi:hypothetical protein
VEQTKKQIELSPKERLGGSTTTYILKKDEV